MTTPSNKFPLSVGTKLLLTPTKDKVHTDNPWVVPLFDVGLNALAKGDRDYDSNKSVVLDLPRWFSVTRLISKQQEKNGNKQDFYTVLLKALIQEPDKTDPAVFDLDLWMEEVGKKGKGTKRNSDEKVVINPKPKARSKSIYAQAIEEALADLQIQQRQAIAVSSDPLADVFARHDANAMILAEAQYAFRKINFKHVELVEREFDKINGEIASIANNIKLGRGERAAMTPKSLLANWEAKLVELEAKKEEYRKEMEAGANEVMDLMLIQPSIAKYMDDAFQLESVLKVNYPECWPYMRYKASKGLQSPVWNDADLAVAEPKAEQPKVEQPKPEPKPEEVKPVKPFEYVDHAALEAMSKGALKEYQTDLTYHLMRAEEYSEERKAAELEAEYIKGLLKSLKARRVQAAAAQTTTTETTQS